jgi:choline monooxygenase
MGPLFEIDDNIRRAHLPPAALYGDAAWFEAVVERVFRRSWRLLFECDDAPEASAVPVRIGGVPALFTRTRDQERLLSNVCTHRGALVVDEPCILRTLRCPYHGRRWSLDGQFSAAPGFEGAEGFPAARDNLALLALGALGPWRVGAVDPISTQEDWAEGVLALLEGLWPAPLSHQPDQARHYDIPANWALYVDNYLEGFHVPYVHPGLAAVLDPRDYRQQLLPWGTLQVGMAQRPEEAFDLPGAHPLSGQQVAALYIWLFPNLMINVYPWGVSVNLVQPVGPQQTRVVYRSWVGDPERLGSGAGGDLHTVELEDQSVVARAQAGVRSPLYPGGRYSPEHEVGVHHFHRLLARCLR